MAQYIATVHKEQVSDYDSRSSRSDRAAPAFADHQVPRFARSLFS